MSESIATVAQNNKFTNKNEIRNRKCTSRTNEWAGRHARALWRFPEVLFVRTWLTGTKSNRSMNATLHFDTEPNGKLKTNKRKTITIAHRHRANAFLRTKTKRKNKHDSLGVQNPCVVLTAYSGCIMYNEPKQMLLKCNTFQLYGRLCSHLGKRETKSQNWQTVGNATASSFILWTIRWPFMCALPNCRIQWLYTISVIAFTIWNHIYLNWSSLELIELHCTLQLQQISKSIKW